MKRLIFILLPFLAFSQNKIIGSQSYVHLEQINNVWWFVNADGEKFFSTGMNHINDKIRFANYNKDFWTEKFGKNMFIDGKLNYNAENEIKKWVQQIVKDHKDYGFNTIAFHRPTYLPEVYFNELGIYFLGKLKTGEIHAGRVKRYNSKFPDVFSEAFTSHVEKVAEAYCSKHRNSKYLIGYTYDDLPSYSFEEYHKKIKYEGHANGMVFHPWVTDIINTKKLTNGKAIWISILREHYKTPRDAGDNYRVSVNSWQDLEAISTWNKPLEMKKWQRDQTAMLKKIVRQWHHINRNTILKFDPHHLIFGDKISCHGQGHPDWVYKIVGEYVDVLFIQDYEFFKPKHITKLKRLHKLSGKPILNGDHSYGYTVPEMNKAKGLSVENHHAVGEEYYTYLMGISNLPFMLGWHNCGYIEQWKGSKLDQTGKEQTGFFDPFGKPRLDALKKVKEANEKTLFWHEKAGENEFLFSQRNRNW